MSIFNIEKLEEIDEVTKNELIGVWENSVRATHTFLKESDIQKLKPIVREGLSQVEKLFCVKERKKDIKAFLGVEEKKVEMLFVSPDVRGEGIGRTLMSHAINKLEARYVDVNEQNPLAVGFYEHLGFEVFDRSELDDQKNSFPILHMSIKVD